MKFRVLSLHTNIFKSFLSESLIARGISKDIIDVDLVDWREWGVGNYNQVDDKPFGGGAGMVLQPEPLYQALSHYDGVSDLFQARKSEHVRTMPNNKKFYDQVEAKSIKKKSATIALTPKGYQFNQSINDWVVDNFDEVNIVCGRYEGFDSRFLECVDMELSMGPYVLNGGEVAAMTMIEAMARKVPKFVEKSISVEDESFDKLDIDIFDEQEYVNNLLRLHEYPQYTRPEIWRGIKVSEVLLSGHHKNIDDWRKNYQLDLYNHLKNDQAS